MVGADCNYTGFRQCKCSIGLDTHDVELTNGSIMVVVRSANVSMIVVPIMKVPNRSLITCKCEHDYCSYNELHASGAFDS